MKIQYLVIDQREVIEVKDQTGVIEVKHVIFETESGFTSSLE